MDGRHIVVGTAGHVDHGKSALVLALTGTDTDRWAEEKRRGITIDIGFAHLDLGDGVAASIVDVPGHEDFVRNMVAGATGIDLAMLVVAADEGVMPQTREHLEILRFLGITHGVIAITKTDLVEEEWLELVVEDVASTARELTAGGGMEWEDPVPVSARSGHGLDRLREVLKQTAARTAAGDPSDLFRMPVDRSFSVAGAGTVVTGTTWSGAAAVGDEVRVLPAGTTARIRGIEVHDRPAEQALPGRRTALALVGVDRDSVGRGDFAVRGPDWIASRRVDALVTLLPNARPLTQRSRIRVHLGTAEIMARVTPAGEDIEPGGTGVVRLRLDRPLVCRWGDRGVLRAYSPMTTVGGCFVLDPSPEPRPRRPSADPGLQSSDEARRVRALVEARGELTTNSLTVRLGVHPDRVSELLLELEITDVRQSGQSLLSSRAAQAATERALAAVTAFHGTDPLKPGLPLDAFRRAAGDGALADHARTVLESSGAIVVDRGKVRLEGHAATLGPGNQPLADAILSQLGRSGAEGVSFAEMKGAGDVDRDQFLEVAEFLVRQGGVLRIGTDRYYTEDALRAAVAKVLGHLEKAGGASPAEFRDLLGLSRKYLIPLLEWMDGQGITARGAEVRNRGPKAHLWV